MFANQTSVVLSPGSFFGTMVRSHEFSGFRISETYYEGQIEIPTHSHELPFFCYVLQGSFQEVKEARSYQCRKGTVVYHPPHDKHSDFVDPLNKTRCLNVELIRPSNDILRLFFANDYEAWKTEDAETSSLAMSLYREFRNPDDFSELAIEGITLELLAAGLRSNTNVYRVPSWLAKIHDILTTSYMENFSLAKLACEANVHRVHLARSFRKHYGSTVADYVRRLRIDSACRLLSQTDLSIIEISIATGFCDQSHFTKIFRRLTRMTPTEFRKLI